MQRISSMVSILAGGSCQAQRCSPLVRRAAQRRLHLLAGLAPHGVAHRLEALDQGRAVLGGAGGPGGQPLVHGVEFGGRVTVRNGRVAHETASVSAGSCRRDNTGSTRRQPSWLCRKTPPSLHGGRQRLHPRHVLAEPGGVLGGAVEGGARLEQLVLALERVGAAAGQEFRHRRLVHRREGLHRLEGLVEVALILDAGDDHRGLQIQREVQVLDRLDRRIALQDHPVAEGLHGERRDAVLHQIGQHEVAEAAEMRVHHVERHLHGIEVEAALGRHFEHLEVDARVLVAGEADIAQLAGFFGLDERLHGAALGEDPIGVVVAQDLVMLDEVDPVGAQAAQRLVDLLSTLR